MPLDRERCPNCGRLQLETAAARWRRKFLSLYPEDTHAWIGLLLNKGCEVAETEEPSAVGLAALRRFALDLRDQGHDVPLDWRDLAGPGNGA